MTHAERCRAANLLATLTEALEGAPNSRLPIVLRFEQQAARDVIGVLVFALSAPGEPLDERDGPESPLDCAPLDGAQSHALARLCGPILHTGKFRS